MHPTGLFYTNVFNSEKYTKIDQLQFRVNIILFFVAMSVFFNMYILLL